MKYTISKYIFAFACLLGGASGAAAQDLIARQAPVERLVKSADSVVINRVIKNAALTNLESNELYSSWNTSKVHCYSSSEIPETYKIDLRGFRMPTPSRNITSNFGYRPTFHRMHKGLDIKVYIGDTIVAAFDGKVRMVGYEASGYGNYVVIRHRNGLETIYGHLSKSIAREGDFVKAGQTIGLGGNTGRSFGSHLHFETRIVGVAIDPSLLFDFRNQDVTCNTFTFRYRDCDGGILSRATMERNHQEVAQAVPTGRMYQVEGRRVSVQSVAEKLGLTVEALCDLNGFTQGTVLTRGQMVRY